jgi:hypothetical protein
MSNKGFHIIGAHILGYVRDKKLFEAVYDFGVEAAALVSGTLLYFFVQGKREAYLERPVFLCFFGIFQFLVLIYTTINCFGIKSNIFQLFYNNLLTTVSNYDKLYSQRLEFRTFFNGSGQETTATRQKSDRSLFRGLEKTLEGAGAV